MLIARLAVVPSLRRGGTAPTLHQRRAIGSCCIAHYFDETAHGDTAFQYRSSNVKFGKGVLHEIGADVSAQITHRRALQGRLGTGGAGRVVLMTDARVARLQWMNDVRASLRAHKHDVVLYDTVRVEPTLESFLEAARFVRDARPDAVVSVGGGSVMDTAKAALLYGFAPPPDNDPYYYVNAPVGRGQPVPFDAVWPPHIAVPTTSGTGAETTGIAVMKVGGDGRVPVSKTGVVSMLLAPDAAVIEPAVAHTLPQCVIAASGFDVLSHAAESFTARPFTQRALPNGRTPLRPVNQGANPWSDMGCLEALRLVAQYFERATSDPKDLEAREGMMWAATLAGTAFGNAGVHLPHGLSYAVCGLQPSISKYNPGEGSGYPLNEPLVPHGMGVILCAPTAFRVTGQANPERHLRCASALGVDTRDVAHKDAGELLAKELIRLMRVAHFPMGLEDVGFNHDHVPSLVRSCSVQKRAVANAPINATDEDLANMYRGAMRYHEK